MTGRAGVVEDVRTAHPAGVLDDVAPGFEHAVDVYGSALAAAIDGDAHPLTISGGDGRWSTVDVHGWIGELRGADLSLAARCVGPTLDVGCGPGRFTAAVAAAGTRTLGVDISPLAVRLTRRRGGAALCRSVFQRLPAEGRWRHVLLADGNIGIGGDPARLLARCRSLLAPGGSVLVEVEPPGAGSGTRTVRLRHGERYSQPFRWARVAADDLAAVAAAAEDLVAVATAATLRQTESWTEDGRWFAALAAG